LEPPSRTRGRFVMGRLRAAADTKALRGHTVRARSTGRVLDRTMTDSAGRFLLEWHGENEDVTVDLLDDGGTVVESISLASADLVSPASIGFRGQKLLSRGKPEPKDDRAVVFEADDDSPICVTSSCIEVTLSWALPSGSVASIACRGQPVKESLESAGSLKVVERGTCEYALRFLRPGGLEGVYSEKKLEVRRYPSLSLVTEGTTFKKGSRLTLGVSLSCPAGSDGLRVSILSSDEGIIKSTEMNVVPGATWVTTALVLEGRAGKAEVTAKAEGQVPDGVTILVE